MSIDLDTGEILCFDIPPPLASFDGLVAAVSGKGIPVKYPPTLSPTSIATLSPCSSWEQTDEVNSQFEVAFDQHRNMLCWVFSPDCIGSTLMPHASREERLDMNGSLVCWDLTSLPRKEWPPPIHTPCCVAQLPRTRGGRLSSELVIPSIHGVLSNLQLSALYITSSSELIAAITDLDKLQETVQLESDVMSLANFGLPGDTGHDGYTCFAVSWMSPSLLAVGTQKGILLVPISERTDVRRQLFPIEEEASTHYDDKQKRRQSLADQSPEKASLTEEEHRLFEARIGFLESRNEELECQLDYFKLEEHKLATDERMSSLMEEHAEYCKQSETDLNVTLAESRALEEKLELKEHTCNKLKIEVDALKGDLEHMSHALEREQSSNKDLAKKLMVVAEKTRELQRDDAAIKDLIKTKQEECNDLYQQLDEFRLCERDSRETRGPYKVSIPDESESLRQALVNAKESQDSLRDYINLLEEDKAAIDRELEDSRQQAEKYAKKHANEIANLCAKSNEQKSAIDSLVDLLERQRINHDKETAAQEEELSTVKHQLSNLQLRRQNDSDEKDQSNEVTLARLKAENDVFKADASMSSQIYLAMRSELQNALNELAKYQHGDHKV